MNRTIFLSLTLALLAACDSDGQRADDPFSGMNTTGRANDTLSSDNFGATGTTDAENGGETIDGGDTVPYESVPCEGVSGDVQCDAPTPRPQWPTCETLADCDSLSTDCISGYCISVDDVTCPAEFNAEFIDSLRGCTSDADCVLATYQYDCCGSWSLGAVDVANLGTFTSCAPKPEDFGACGCPGLPLVAEDRREARFDLSNVAAYCDADNTCRSRVTYAGRCPNEVTCPLGQLCAFFENTDDPFVCADNPCEGAISCDCAASVCASALPTAYDCLMGPAPGTGTELICGDVP